MNESYRLGEQSIIAYLQRLANGVSTAELDVAALPTELCAIGEQLQKTFAILQQERELLERGAYIDSLTNLGNRAGLHRYAELLWHKGTPFTCAYIDIDRLKHCNDTFGHTEGNRYILSICRALTETMNPMTCCSVSVETNLYSYPPRQMKPNSSSAWSGRAPTLSRQHRAAKRP